MSDDQIEDITTEEESEPIYYKPKALSMIATISAWVSWVVLVVFIFVVISQLFYIIGIGSQNQKTLIEMLQDPAQGEQVRLFIYTNMLLPFFTGLTFFLLLQAANIGLNSLLEIDFNLRELNK